MTLYVNGEKIDDKEIQEEFEKLRPQYDQAIRSENPEEHLGQLYEWSRENIIERVILRQEALNEPERIPADEIEKKFQELIEQNGGKEKLFEQIDNECDDKEKRVKQDIELDLRLERLIKKITDKVPEPSEQDVREYYKQNSKRFINPETIRVSHIVKQPTSESDVGKIQEQMQQILAQLREKANFAELAQQHSDCPENGGDLGYFARGQMVQEFEDIVFNLEPGEISNIFQTDFGYHIAKLIDRRPPSPCTLAEVRDSIIEELKQQQSQKSIEDFVDKEKANATIEERHQ
ncbi:MAG: peptidylprolyl isomerase [Sedimentisphaerales bacterium]|nr:peptidylprolyl isomerase [Sedimentisphaerales bacterium]